MAVRSMIDNMKNEMRDVLDNNILNFWIVRMTDNENGGYYGRMDGHGNIDRTAVKGAILNARILWSFAAAYRVTAKAEYLEAALRAKRYIIDNFYDSEYGGVYWSVDCNGAPADTKKQTYAIGFMIYGMSELARATGDAEALDMAVRLFHDIEEHAFDSHNNGYLEAMTREWGRIDDMRLSDKDENGAKTMNTHLHILEPYTNLYRVWKDGLLESRLRNLISLFTDVILNHDTWHLDLFFDDAWNGKRNIQSYGHDIEASWLLHEAALELGDAELLADVEPSVRKVADAADEGLHDNGAMIYEKWTDTGKTDSDYHWWVQCESIIGHVNLYQHFGDVEAWAKARRNWEFVKKYLVDKEGGEWYWSLRSDGSINKDDDKAGFWKCPYHNSRMCIEIIERAEMMKGQ